MVNAECTFGTSREGETPSTSAIKNEAVTNVKKAASKIEAREEYKKERVGQDIPTLFSTFLLFFFDSCFSYA